MKPFKRGVSDLGCGRGHDRRRGQISWSLTPRSTCRRGDDPGEVERSATRADRALAREAAVAHLLAVGPERYEARLARISSARVDSRKGEHPALCPVPPGVVSGLRFREPQNRVCRRCESSAGDLIRCDGALVFQFANQFVDVLRQPLLGPNGGVQLLPSFRTTLEPIQYPVSSGRRSGSGLIRNC
jgi:hypothetical protein